MRDVDHATASPKTDSYDSPCDSLKRFNSFRDVPHKAHAEVVIDGKTQYLGHVEYVFHCDDNYIVYSSINRALEYTTSEALSDNTEEFSKIWNRVVSLQSVARYSLDEQHLHRAQAQMANAITASLLEHHAAAEEAIASAESYVHNVSQQANRQWFAVGVLLGSVALIIAGFAIIGDQWRSGSLSPLSLVALALWGGTVGTILSALSRRIRHIQFDPYEGHLVAGLYGALRPLYGSVAAFFVVTALYAGVFDGVLAVNENVAFRYLLFAILGGFGERQTANLVSYLSKQLR